MPFPHFWLLLVWVIVGTCLRLIHLGMLPPWTDECATVVFSLGNSFYNVPLNQFISLQTLMEPLQLNPSAGINNVIDLLLTESTHPPLFFVLTHLWLKLFPTADGLVSIWAARFLSAGLGVLAIPAIFYFAKFTSKSLIVAQIAAVMMAVSPFGIFLSLQARHYTLITLLIIATLSCFIRALRSIDREGIIPFWLVLVWIGVNCLGVASHYFFVLTLAAMAIAFSPLFWSDWRQDRSMLGKSQWRRLYLVALGSLIGCLVWLPSLMAVRESSPTDWIYASNAAEKWLEPIGRFLLWLMSTAILLPSSLYDFPLGIIIVAGILTLVFWFWSLPPIWRGLRLQQQQSEQRGSVIALVNYLIAAIALFFGFTYFLGMDLTLAGRFQFVYFPVVIVLIAFGLGKIWEQSNLTSETWFSATDYGRRFVVVFLAVGLFSGVVANLKRGYLQNHRPDLAIAQIAEGSTAPIAIATTYRHHGQTGRMIGLAWGLRNLTNINTPQFLLASEADALGLKSSQILSEQLATIKRPLDLWLVNFRGDVELEAQNCLADSQYQGMSGQYKYKLYRCRD
ncbi:MAG: glycosyltransferase family 39 protein [Cyanobacteria bacterium P01_G01_bin.67]